MPSPRYGFRFEAEFQLCNLNLSLSVYLRTKKCYFPAKFVVCSNIFARHCSSTYCSSTVKNKNYVGTNFLQGRFFVFFVPVLLLYYFSPLLSFPLPGIFYIRPPGCRLSNYLACLSDYLLSLFSYFPASCCLAYCPTNPPASRLSFLYHFMFFLHFPYLLPCLISLPVF